MTIRWSAEALLDVERLVDFVAEYDLDLANKVEQQLIRAPRKLPAFPRRGTRLSEFDPREVRELRIRKYLLRYELAGPDIRILRFFHGREDRFAPRSTSDS